MTKEEYDKVKASGMMWEFHPELSGDWEKDKLILNHPSRVKSEKPKKDNEKGIKNQVDYSEYECPYAHLKKECGHKLHGPEGYEDTYGVWCPCGFRGPVFYLEPEDLKLKKKTH
jgi:hypothetical protein